MKLMFNFWFQVAISVSCFGDAPLGLEKIRDQITTSEPGEVNLVTIGAELSEVVANAPFNAEERIEHRVKAAGEVAIALLEETSRRKLLPSNAEWQATASSIKTLLSAVDKNIIEGYKPLPVRANIAPPGGTSGAATGMNPHAIDNAAIRDQYLKSIAEERDKALKNLQQQSLQSLRRTILIQLTAQSANTDIPRKDFIESFTEEGRSRQELERRLKE